MKYSIWLIPSSPTFNTLQNIINSLAEKFISPKFEPHITALGNIEIDFIELKTALNKIAIHTHPFELNLGEVSFSSTYFQSILVRVQANASLMQLHLDVIEALHCESPAFMPHISVLYGNFDMLTREKIATSIQFPPTSFVVNEFIITPATMNPNEWDHLATIPFS